MEGWYLSNHAIERALDMALDAEEIRTALLRPDRLSPSVKYPGCENRVSGRILLATNPAERVVITIGWNLPNPWDRYDRNAMEEELERIRDR
jgi:hypothetical protein